MDKDYLARRRQIESKFLWYRRKSAEREEFESPSGSYVLTVDSFSAGSNTWEYTRGLVRKTGSAKIIADVKRNFSHFWHSWIEHANGNEYLLCGEDYQGQTIVNLSEGTTRSFFPPAAYEGHGFCWTAAYASEDSAILAVDGCYWACPYEIVFFDFSKPDCLPYEEYLRVGSVIDCDGWTDDGRFKLTTEMFVRKSDGCPYDDLSDAEQDELDNNSELSETVRQDKVVTREQILKGRL